MFRHAAALGARVSLVLLAAGCGSGIEVTLPADDADVVNLDAAVDADPGDVSDVGPVDADAIGDGADVADIEADADADVVETCPEGTSCTDFDPCTIDDQCDADGVCVGTTKECDDGLACTVDSCDDKGGECVNALQLGYCLAEEPEPACVPHGVGHPANTCRFCAAVPPTPTFVPTNAGLPCEDGDVCTLDETCLQGECKAQSVLECDESADACFTAACDSDEGCIEVPTTAACDDGDVCTDGDTCSDGACVPGADVMTCDDADPCTVDTCDGIEGCVYAAAACDDGNPCTVDACDGGDCSYTTKVGACDDGDACTAGESCVGEVCAGGVDVSCDDDNPCTADGCDTADGCVNELLTGACDDGFDCTTDDTCVLGQCLGAKQTCDACPAPNVSHAQKISLYELGSSGVPGSGLDVDGDPTTCAPEGDCVSGVDNALSVMSLVVNEPLASSIESGLTMLILDLRDAVFDGTPFAMSMFDSELTSASANCDFTAHTCTYYPVQSAFGPSCEPRIQFPNAQMSAGKLIAGGDDTTVSLVFDISETSQFVLTLAQARLLGIYKLNEAGSQVASITGVIAGAVPKQQLIDGISTVSEDDLPIDKATAIGLLELLVVEDVDVDGDGTPDAASVGLRFESIPAKLGQP